MADQEEIIRKLEQQFPAMSGIAFAEASKRALASGQRILQTEQGVIYEYSPDGSKRLIKKIDPPTPSYPGQKIIIAPAKG